MQLALEEFYSRNGVRGACKAAIGRLPRVQGEVIDALFFQNQTPDQLALARKRSRSTINNNEAKAKKNMERDDCFYIALFQLGILRDRTRAAEISYPTLVTAGSAIEYGAHCADSFRSRSRVIRHAAPPDRAARLPH